MMQESNMIDVASRHADLRHMLIERRREMQDTVESRGDIELALLQMRADTLTRIDEALVRLDARTYGFCFECEREISERRLRALPFAGRCQACEERREQEEGHARQIAQQRGSLSLFPEVVSS
jgi:DnaK suppressor protein